MPAVPGDPGFVAIAPLPSSLLPGGANGGPPPPERPDGIPLLLFVEAGGRHFFLWTPPGPYGEEDDGKELPWSAVAWYQIVSTPPAARRLLGLPWAPSIPFPDGVVGPCDRRQLAQAYRGILSPWQ